MSFMKNFLITFISLILSFSISCASAIAITNNLDNSDITDKNKENTNKLEDKKELKAQKSEADLFGDEQTFPFVAGLGKNAAH